MRNFALVLLGLFFCSSSRAVSGFLQTSSTSRFFPQTQTGKFLGQVQPSLIERKTSLTILSSKE